MIFVADENVERQTLERLRVDGHEIIVIPASVAGADDEVILALAGERDAVLITGDKGFGELVFRRGFATGGVLLIRLFGLSEIAKAAIVSTAVHQHGARMPGAFTVIAPGLVRIRQAI
jgi:predicted nuclease of predicted toxin-antitoxin system